MRTQFPILTLSFLLLASGQAFALNLPLADSLAPVVSQSTTSGPVTPVAENAGAAAQAMIDKLGKTAMGAIADTAMPVEKKKQVFHQVLSQNFDMNTIGRFAAGRFWREATPPQQQEFLRLYQAMVINVYTSRFNNYSGQAFSVTGNRMDEGGDAVVSSQVTGDGSPLSVDWRVRNKGNGPKIIDVMVEGVSMAVTQRNDFAGVIQQGGGTFQALIDYLKKGGTSDVQE